MLLFLPLKRRQRKDLRSPVADDGLASPSSGLLSFWSGRLAAPPLTRIHVLGGMTDGEVRVRAVAAAEATLLLGSSALSMSLINDGLRVSEVGLAGSA